ncbi:hypothetical protein FQN53_008214 [Emmonsiellopsis sp. PD_33]|nr:hypothetical protein FQN53_008214 [Emmonsiellopsis sp. PD_33]
MPDAKSTGAGLVDLETELTCSICTDILYQPLTLLDCLHTFCGSCLKEWFSWQASNPPDSSRDPKFTCPSCRASIRETRHDAKVTTLLDLFLQSNPHRARKDEEKREIEQKYKPGDIILPVRRGNSRSSGSDGDEGDRRLIAEVREMSLRDVEQRHNRASPRTSRTRNTRERVPVTRERDRQEEAQRRRRNARRAASQQPESLDLASRTRQIEHQSSLRSLLSGSDGDSAIEEEILRQIVDEGLLDGIDLRTLDPAQEDELSERIADAYRRRHLRQSTSQLRTHSAGHDESHPSRSRQSRSNSTNDRTTEVARRPPASRSHLLEPSSRTSPSSHQQRSSSDQGIRRRTTSPSPRTASSSSEALLQPAARSSSDLTDSRRFGTGNPPSTSFRHRATSSLSSARRSGESERRVRQAGVRTTERRQILDTPNTTSPVTASPPQSRFLTQSNPSPQSPSTAPSSEGVSSTDRREPPRVPSSRPSSSREEVSTQSNENIFPEPSISCDRCDKREIQYEIHRTCNKCNDGNYNLCLLCYRMGRGCQHWFGFGETAKARFDKKYPLGSSVVREPPHVLQSRKYLRPLSQSQSSTPRRRTNDDPTKRLQSGMFCDLCHSFADDCFWTCSICNQGEWGFCNGCVNQGKCCTHALLPIARVKENDTAQSRSFGHSTAQHSPNLTSTHVFGSPITIGPGNYRPLTFSTKCNNCTYPIPPSTTRFHCPTCNDGDYDLCTNCYLKLGANGKISKDNGRNGWRRCLQGHRMTIVGFEDHIDGQRRVVVKDLVGGHALKDDFATNQAIAAASSTDTSMNSESTPSAPIPIRQDSGDWIWKDDTGSSTAHRRRTPRSRTAWSSISSPTTPTDHTGKLPFSSHFPPSGGIGLRLLALWSYYPDPDVMDEILFPRGAEITEAENINDDWMWGCYAGQKGLFPGSYVMRMEAEEME